MAKRPKDEGDTQEGAAEETALADQEAPSQAGTTTTGVVHPPGTLVTRPLADVSAGEDGSIFQRPFGSEPRNINTETGEVIRPPEPAGGSDINASQGGSGALGMPGTGNFAPTEEQLQAQGEAGGGKSMDEAMQRRLETQQPAPNP